MRTLDPIEFGPDDPYRDPAAYREGERFWWHQTIVNELKRLRDECTNPDTGQGYHAFSITGLAGNIKGANAYDTLNHCRQMITWGELVQAEPLWDFEPELWVALRD